jgi:stage V sporulation protein SpoVS
MRGKSISESHCHSQTTIAQRDSSVPLKAIPGLIELEIAGRDKTGMQFIIDK